MKTQEDKEEHRNPEQVKTQENIGEIWRTPDNFGEYLG